MTKGELIEALENSDLPDDAEVMMAQQPHYPLNYFIAGVAERDGKVYILEGEQEGYGERSLWQEVW